MQNNYHVIDSAGEYYEFDSWYDLIKELRRFDLKQIGHNFNDSFCIKKFGYNYLYNERILVDFVVFDSLWRVVDKSTLKPAFENFVYQRKSIRWKVFEYRKEPVPWTGGGGRFHGSIFRRRNRNKSYAAKLEEYYNLFPNSGRIRERKHLVKSWNDDLKMRCQDKGWKRQFKIKKQWMKHM